tara:strand:+ start:4112 stop:4624 length:513 start_codon:yes stop_codon:yes gene_type:complete
METKKHRTDCLRAEVKNLILGFVRANVEPFPCTNGNFLLEIKSNHKKEWGNNIQIWLDKDENGFDMLMIKENGVVKTNKTYFGNYKLIDDSLRIIAQDLVCSHDFFGHTTDTFSDDRKRNGINIAKHLNENLNDFCWHTEYSRVIATLMGCFGKAIGFKDSLTNDYLKAR